MSLWIPVQCNRCQGEGKIHVPTSTTNGYAIQDCMDCYGKGLTFIPIEDLIKEIDKRR